MPPPFIPRQIAAGDAAQADCATYFSDGRAAGKMILKFRQKNEPFRRGEPRRLWRDGIPGRLRA